MTDGTAGQAHAAPGTDAGTTAGTAADASFRSALRRLRSAQKTAKGVSLYSRYVNRPAGRVLAALAYRLGLTPNQVTLVSAVFSFAGLAAPALLRPSWPLAAGAYAALALGFALDSADGQLARLRGRSSPAGEWLDHVVDCAKIVALHTAVLIAFHRYFTLPGPEWLLLPLAFQWVAVLLFVGGLLADKLKPRPAPGLEAAAPADANGGGRAGGAARPSRVRAVALLPVDHGVFCAVFLLFGDERLFLAGYTLLFAAHLLFLGGFLVKWFRELSVPRPG